MFEAQKVQKLRASWKPFLKNIVIPQCQINNNNKNFGAERLSSESIGKLVENNSSKKTRRKQLVENTRRKTRRKATRRKFTGGKLGARIEINLRQI